MIRLTQIDLNELIMHMFNNNDAVMEILPAINPIASKGYE